MQYYCNISVSIDNISSSFVFSNNCNKSNILRSNCNISCNHQYYLNRYNILRSNFNILCDKQFYCQFKNQYEIILQHEILKTIVISIYCAVPLLRPNGTSNRMIIRGLLVCCDGAIAHTEWHRFYGT